jgi:hypothetical protein
MTTTLVEEPGVATVTEYEADAENIVADDVDLAMRAFYDSLDESDGTMNEGWNHERAERMAEAHMDALKAELEVRRREFEAELEAKKKALMAELEAEKKAALMKHKLEFTNTKTEAAKKMQFMAEKVKQVAQLVEEVIDIDKERKKKEAEETLYEEELYREDDNWDVRHKCMDPFCAEEHKNVRNRMDVFSDARIRFWHPNPMMPILSLFSHQMRIRIRDQVLALRYQVSPDFLQSKYHSIYVDTHRKILTLAVAVSEERPLDILGPDVFHFKLMELPEKIEDRDDYKLIAFDMMLEQMEIVTRYMRDTKDEFDSPQEQLRRFNKLIRYHVASGNY